MERNLKSDTDSDSQFHIFSYLLYFQVFPDFGLAFYAIFYAICYQDISAYNDLYEDPIQSYAIYAIVRTVFSFGHFICQSLRLFTPFTPS